MAKEPGKGRSRAKPADGSKESRRSAGRNSIAVVGIGASAGGLEAFGKLFTAMPEDTGIAFVLIQHLDPKHKSLTAEIIGKHTPMRVVQVTDEMHIEPNRLYVIPPNRYLSISGETLHLTEPVERRGVRVPIDFFLRSLADDQRERGIAIILSGAGSDGTLGAREIKAAGGMVMVETPETAMYDGMPRSVINSGVADYVLPVEKMPEVLRRYVQHWYVNGTSKPPPTAEQTPDHLNGIIAILRARLKYDFSCYKKGTLTRRVQRRMGLRHILSMKEYLDVLRHDKNEVGELYKDLLIGVTNFFREPEAWDTLAEEVIKPLVRRRNGDSQIRVWVPGCATGEEPYSLAMLFIEAFQEAELPIDINIFASDIDHDALTFARAGVYPESIAADVKPERLRRFFVKGEHSYRINKEARDTVIFAEQNLVSDPPFSKLELISCRNLLIYLEPDVQKRVLSLFHFALRDGGYLFLGNAETVGQQQYLFQVLSRKWRIYRSIGPTRHDDLRLPAVTHPPRTTAPPVRQAEDRSARRLGNLAQQALLARYAPACVLVNRKAEVLYLYGRVDDYLQLPRAELRADIVGMARPGLRTRLRAAIDRAVREQKVVTVDDVRIKRGDRYFPARVTVEPLRSPPDMEGLLLVAFEEGGPDHKNVRVVYIEPPEPEVTDKPTNPEEYEALIHHLESELGSAREDLQTTIEELETSNEEFKAANEEVTSINEELQSTNEELETSKEELQSMNEELQTVNSQLEGKISEIESANNDLRNLLASIDHATLFLDRDFRIKRITPAATELLRVIENDCGRPFSDFAKNIEDGELLADAARVLQHLRPIEKEVRDSKSRRYLRRIVPYRTEDDRIGGVVVTFIDVTSRFIANEFIRLTVEAAPIACLMVDADGRIALVNAATEKLFGYNRSELTGRPVEMLVPANLRAQHRYDRVGYESAPAARPMGVGRELCGLRRDGSQVPVEIALSPVDTPQGRHILATVVDISMRKEAERALKTVNESLEQEVARRTSLLQLVHDIAGAAHQSRTVEEAMRYAVRRVCEYAGWYAGHVYRVGATGLVPADVWYVGDPHDLSRFVKAFGATRLRLSSRGLVPDVARQGVPQWSGGPRAQRVTEPVRRTVLRGVAAFPVLVHSEVSAVLVFYSKEAIAPDQKFLDAMRSIGIQLGLVIERRSLEKQLTEVTDAEQRRLGEELHDSIGQQLTGIGMMTRALYDELKRQRSPYAKQVSELAALIERAHTRSKVLTSGLIPGELDRRGLQKALADLARQTEKSYSISCKFNCKRDVVIGDSFTATQLFRIAQEAVHNCVKHSNAKRITIQLGNSRGVTVSVRDNGDGMPAKADHRGRGIHIMRHRAGLIGAQLTIDPAPGGGTVVTCLVPQGQKATDRSQKPRKPGRGSPALSFPL